MAREAMLMVRSLPRNHHIAFHKFTAAMATSAEEPLVVVRTVEVVVSHEKSACG